MTHTGLIFEPDLSKISWVENDPVTDYAIKVHSGEILAGPWVRASCKRHLCDLQIGAARGLYWDLSKAMRAIEFFPDMLRLTDGDKAGEPFHLLQWQKFIVGSLMGWLGPDGYRRFRTGYIETGKGPLALDTPIATTKGWKTMGTIEVGDEVFDENGKPCFVTDVSPVFYNRDCYKLKFSDGAEIVADAVHEWKTAALRTGGKPGPKPANEPRKGDYAIRNTETIAKTVQINQNSVSTNPQAKWNHRVDVAKTLQLPDCELPVPPYTFGAWLGDGDSDSARLTVAYADWTIVEEIEKEGISAVERTKHCDTTARVLLGSNGRSQAGRNDSLQAKLKAIGVLGNKHIPAIYLRAGVNQRLALLQGLMDTDGTINTSGEAELSLSNNVLAADAIELIRTLGYKPTVSMDAATLYGEDVGTRWRIKFHPFAEQKVFRLTRKAARQKQRPKTRPLSEGRMIVACDRVDSVPVRCITVSSPSHLFLAGEHFVPTHNSGKSPLAGGLALYLLVADGEYGAEVYCAATKLDQAKILFRDAERMVEASPLLRGIVTSTVNNLAVLATHSFFRPVSSEKRGLDGPRVNGAFLDEVHEHSDATVIDKLRAGTKNRKQPLIFEITNSGFDKNTVCWKHHEYSTKILENHTINDTWFSYICALDDGDDWMNDEGCWPKANPSLGHTFEPKYLREQVEEARGMPSKQSIVARLNFCVWTDAENPWIDRERWMACVRNDFGQGWFKGRKVYFALDLSMRKDLTALAAVAPLGGGRFRAMVKFYTPKDTLLKRAKEDNVPYDIWEQQGFLTATPGPTVDYDYVARDLGSMLAASQGEGLAFDPWRILEFQKSLSNEGIDCWMWEGDDKPASGSGLMLVKHGQGYQGATGTDSLWMPRSVELLETAVLNNDLEVLENPVLNWNSASAVLEADPHNNRKFVKRKSTGRIDGIVALCMALGLANKMEEGGLQSIYEQSDSFVEQEPWLDVKVLADPSHPRFAEMKARFEEWQAQQDDLEDF